VRALEPKRRRGKHHGQMHLTRTSESAHACARMCSEPPQRIRRHEGGYNNKTMAVSVWREGKASKTHLVHCSGVVSSAVGSCAQIGLRGRARRRSAPTAATTLTDVGGKSAGWSDRRQSPCVRLMLASCSVFSRQPGKWRKVTRLRGRYRARAESWVLISLDFKLSEGK
jgi:hypothetical protein